MTVEPTEQAFQAYKLYLALKRHFTTDSYDFFKYGGKVNTSAAAFAGRNDINYFRKLAKHNDPKGLLISNLIVDPNKWIGDIVGNADSEQIYVRWLRRQQSITYTLQSALSEIDDFDASIIVKSKQDIPQLIRLYRQGKICLEVLVIIGDLTGAFSYWTKKLPGNMVVAPLNTLYEKYRAFLVYDKSKARQTIKNHYGIKS